MLSAESWKRAQEPRKTWAKYDNEAPDTDNHVLLFILPVNWEKVSKADSYGDLLARIFTNKSLSECNP